MKRILLISSKCIYLILIAVAMLCFDIYYIDNALAVYINNKMIIKVLQLLPLAIISSLLIVIILKKKIGLLAILIFTLVSSCYCLGMFTANYRAINYFKVFSTNKWITYKTERWRMIDSLKEQYVLKDSNRNQVLRLLNKPDFNSTTEYRYKIANSSIGFSSSYLVIRFKNNAVYKIYTQTVNN